MGAGVVHFEVMAKDGKRMQEFYGSLFGWTVDTSYPMNYGIIKPASKGAIGGGIGQVMENQSPYTTFYVAVDNPQAYLDKVVAMGGRMVVPVTEVPGMATFAMFADPEGNMVGLLKNVPPPRKATKAKKSSSRKKASKKTKKSRR